MHTRTAPPPAAPAITRTGAAPAAGIPLIAPAETRLADLAERFAADGLRMISRPRIGLIVAPIVRRPRGAA